MLGREVPPEGVSVRDIAVPLRPHSITIDNIATVGLEMKSDDAFTAIPLVSWDGKCQSWNLRYHRTGMNLSGWFNLGRCSADIARSIATAS